MSVEVFLAFCAERGWTVSEHALRTKPGSRHWHVRSPGLVGTVEVTRSVDGEWTVEVRANRVGSWTVAAETAIRQLCTRTN